MMDPTVQALLLVATVLTGICLMLWLFSRLVMKHQRETTDLLVKVTTETLDRVLTPTTTNVQPTDRLDIHGTALDEEEIPAWAVDQTSGEMVVDPRTGRPLV